MATLETVQARVAAGQGTLIQGGLYRVGPATARGFQLVRVATGSPVTCSWAKIEITLARVAAGLEIEARSIDYTSAIEAGIRWACGLPLVGRGAK